MNNIVIEDRYRNMPAKQKVDLNKDTLKLIGKMSGRIMYASDQVTYAEIYTGPNARTWRMLDYVLRDPNCYESEQACGYAIVGQQNFQAQKNTGGTITGLTAGGPTPEAGAGGEKYSMVPAGKISQTTKNTLIGVGIAVIVGVASYFAIKYFRTHKK